MEKHRFGFSRKPMPATCPDCGLKMSAVKYDNKPWSGVQFYGSDRTDRFYRECACGCMIGWSYPHNFLRRHVLPDPDRI
jgi:hypothetical protein